MNNKKSLGTITKNDPSTMIAAAVTITPVLASVARILGIRSLQKLERKGIVNKRIHLYYLAGTMIAMAGILHLVVASHVLGGVS